MRLPFFLRPEPVASEGLSGTSVGCQLRVKPQASSLGEGLGQLLGEEAEHLLPAVHGLHRLLPALVRRLGYELGYVDVVARPRRAGTSNYGMWDRLWVGILDLAGVWWLIRRRRRVPQVSEVKNDAH